MASRTRNTALLCKQATPPMSICVTSARDSSAQFVRRTWLFLWSCLIAGQLDVYVIDVA